MSQFSEVTDLLGHVQLTPRSISVVVRPRAPLLAIAIARHDAVVVAVVVVVVVSVSSSTSSSSSSSSRRVVVE